MAVRARILALVLALAGVLGGLLGGALALPAGAAAKPKVVATIAQLGEPLDYMLGAHAEVIGLMGPGVDPHLYRPTRSDILKLAQANIIVWTGQTLESKMAGAIARLGADKPALAVIEAVGPDLLLKDPQLGRDPHLWMDPALWRAALGAAVELVAGRVSEDAAADIAARASDYFATLEDLGRYADQVLASVPAERRVLVTAHDAFHYFGRRFDLRVEGVQGPSTESEAGLMDVERLVALLVTRAIPAVFAETSVSDRNVQALIAGAAARGHAVVLGGRLFSDAMGRPGTYLGTYIGMIDHNASTIARGLGGAAPEGGFRAWRRARAGYRR